MTGLQPTVACLSASTQYCQYCDSVTSSLLQNDSRRAHTTSVSRFVMSNLTLNILLHLIIRVIAAPSHDSAEYAVVSSCVHPSVRLSQAGIVLKRINIKSRKQRRMIAQGV